MKKGCVDDLATLLELSPEVILDEVQARYNKDVFYVRGRELSFRCVCFAIDIVIDSIFFTLSHV